VTEFPGPEGPIREVTTGMTVIDADGETVGTVDDVRMADAGAVTGAGQTSDEPRVPFALVAGAFTSRTEMDQQAQERLVRLGYVRVDASGLLSGVRYVEPNQIASVVGDEVRLSVAADQLLR
jgi:hypothetical protein